MKTNFVFLLLVEVLLGYSFVQGRRNGSPVCVTLPGHGSPDDALKSIYAVSSNVTKVRAGEAAQISIVALFNDQPFLGFMISVFEGESETRVGTFQPNGMAQVTPCADSKAATHIENNAKTRVDLVWKAPIEPSGGNYTIVAAIVPELSRYTVLRTVVGHALTASPPGPPDGLPVALNASANSITLAWPLVSFPNSGDAIHTIQVWVSGRAANGTWWLPTIGCEASNIKSIDTLKTANCTINDLDDDSPYQIRIRALNSYGSSDFGMPLVLATIFHDTVPPVSPVLQPLQDRSVSSLSVQWGPTTSYVVGTNRTEAFVTSYIVQYRSLVPPSSWMTRTVYPAGSPGSVTLDQVQQPSDSIVLEGLLSNTTYAIKVVATSFVGDSPPSNTLEARTTEAPRRGEECTTECRLAGGLCQEGICTCPVATSALETNSVKLGPSCSEPAVSACMGGDSKFCLSWLFRVDPILNVKVVHLAMQARTTGWVGILLNPRDGRMSSADTIIGWVDDETGVPSALDMFSSSTGAVPSRDEEAETSAQERTGQSDILQVGGTQAGGVTTIHVVRKVTTADLELDFQFLAESEMVTLSWAVGASDDYRLGHASSADGRGVVQLDLGQRPGEPSAGVVVLGETRRNMVLAHGVFMWLAWAALLPVGSALAYRAKALDAFGQSHALQRKESVFPFRTSRDASIENVRAKPLIRRTRYFMDHPALFKAHRACQATGVAFTVVGTLLVLAAPNRGFASNPLATSTFHTHVGLLILLGCVAQGVIGMRFHSDNAHLVHQWIAPVLLGLAYIKQIPSGQELIGSTTASQVGILLAPCLFVAIVLGVSKPRIVIMLRLLTSTTKTFVKELTWAGATAAIDRYIAKKCYLLGRFVSRRPRFTIVLAFILCILGCLGVLKMTIVTNAEDLYVPKGTLAHVELDIFREHFRDIGSDRIDVQVTSKTKGNILSKETLAAVMELQLQIESLQVNGTDYTTTFMDVCLMHWATSGCIVTSPTLYWQGNYHMMSTDPDIYETISQKLQIDSIGSLVELENVFGGVQYSSTELTLQGEPKISSAESLRLVFPMIPGYEEFQLLAIEFLSSTQLSDPDLEMNFFVNFAKSTELDKAISGDTMLFVLAIITMVTFAVISLGEADAVRGKSALAIAGVLSVVLAIGAGFGVSVVLGFPFTSIHSVLPFLIVGIGLDDMYVIVAGLEEAKNRDQLAVKAGEQDTPRGIEFLIPPEKRCAPGTGQRLVALALSTAGPSVWMTSLTDFVAFIMGLASLMPAVRSFCGFAAICVMTDMMMQLTFFVAFMYLDLVRQLDQRCDVLCCIKPKTASVGVAAAQPPKMSKHPSRNVVQQEMSLQNTFPKAFRVLLLLFKPASKVAVAILYIVLLVVLGIQSMNVRSYMNEWSLLRDDSFLTAWNNNNEQYFKDTSSVSMLMITLDLDYELPETQARMFLLGETFAGQLKQPEDKVASWFSDMVTWVNQTRPAELVDYEISAGGEQRVFSVIRRDQFYPLLERFLARPIVGDFLSKFLNLDCVARDQEDGDFPYCKIESAALVLNTPMDVDSDESIERMLRSREICQLSGFPNEKCSPFLPNSVLAELYLGIPREVVVCMGGALAAVGFVSLISLSHPLAGIICTLSVLVIDIETLGLMHLMGVTLDAVSLVCLVMSVGITFDYVGHITHAFMHSHEEKRATRVVEALIVVGPSVFRSAFSTFVGVLFLGLASADIFRTMFAIFASVILLAAVHSFLFVPVILSLVGPAAPHAREESNLEPDFLHTGEQIDRLLGQSDPPPAVPLPRPLRSGASLCLGCRSVAILLMVVLLAVFALRPLPPPAAPDRLLTGTSLAAQAREWALELRMPPVAVPEEKTSYFCAGLTLPGDAVYHMTAVEPIVDHAEVVHHIVLFACTTPFPREATRCGAMPEGCLELVATWAVGMGPVHFPGHTGVPMGRRTGNLFMAMQMHYDNFRHHRGLVDQSGLRLRLTRALRANDLSVLTVGVNLPWLQLPPGQTATHIVSRCPATPSARDPGADRGQLAKYVGQGRHVTALSVFLHMHEYGRAGEILLYGPDGQEREKMFANAAYNFDFQRYEDIPPTRIYSNDTLYLHCTYDTTSTESVVHGGDATEDEMCLAFVLVYEKSEYARSNPSLALCVGDSLEQELPNEFSLLL